MESLIAVALTAAAFLSVLFYRAQRDRYLNYRAGLAFRAWVVSRMSDVLADPNANETALTYADVLLSLSHDHHRLQSVIAAADANDYRPSPALKQRFHVDILGSHARVIKRALRYTTVLALLEKPGLANGLRKMMAGIADEPLSLVDHLSFDPPSATGKENEEPAWMSDAAEGFLRLPKGRAFEHLVEDRLSACAN